MYRAGLNLRREDPVLRAYREKRLPIQTRARGRCVVLSFENAGSQLWAVVNLGERTTVDLGVDHATVVIGSNEGRFGGNGQAAELW
ncbi:MAG: DUF3459 domain-containing protein [Dehalococcoidia bacterium]